MPSRGVCDRCGFVYWLNDLRKEWTGLMVCRHCFDHRHPQEYTRAVKDTQGVRPDMRPEPMDPSWTWGANYWFDYTSNTGSLGTLTDTHPEAIYVQDSNGLLTSTAANVLCRSDLGLQTVPTRTNLCLRSQAFDNAYWSRTNLGSPVADADTAPDGTTTADRGSDNTSSGLHYFSTNAITFVNGSTYTLSVCAKMETHRYMQLAMTGAISGSGYANFDLQSGVVSASSGFTATIEALDDDWYRCTATVTVTGTSGQFFVIFVNSGTATRFPTYAGTGTTLLLWGAQVELGGYASPPILTTSATASVTGNKQVLSGLGNQLAYGVGGVLEVNVKRLGSSEALLHLSDGTSTNSVQIYQSGGNWVFAVTAGGTAHASITVKTAATGTQVFAFAAGPDFAACQAIGSSDPGSDKTVTYPSLTQLALGGTGYSTTANAYQFTKKVALILGMQGQHTFDSALAMAALI